MCAYGEPLYPQLRYCVRCCMPETTENIEFDELGICFACQSSEQKMHMDWVAREKELRRILEEAKRKAGNNYDCIVPISGGKDSTFQLHVLVKVYGMKPLAVTFSHNWYSETGKYNLQNALEKFNVDHIMFTPNRSLVNRLARRSLDMIGDSCWHCHTGVGSFPLQIAVKFNIPLMVWGENMAEDSGWTTHLDQPSLRDPTWFIQISSRVQPDSMVCEYLAPKDVFPFQAPSKDEIERVGIMRIHLGDYLFWDAERQTEFVRDTYGWREDYIEGAYKQYKSVECRMAGVHDYAKFIKRGFGRGTDQASADVRAGLLTREEGFELAKKVDAERPPGLDYYLEITGMTEKEFVSVLTSLRDGKAKELP